MLNYYLSILAHSNEKKKPFIMIFRSIRFVKSRKNIQLFSYSIKIYAFFTVNMVKHNAICTYTIKLYTKTK